MKYYSLSPFRVHLPDPELEELLDWLDAHNSIRGRREKLNFEDWQLNFLSDEQADIIADEIFYADSYWIQLTEEQNTLMFLKWDNRVTQLLEPVDKLTYDRA